MSDSTLRTSRTIAADVIERAYVFGDRAAQQFIEEHHRLSLESLRRLVRADAVDDPWVGRAIFARNRGGSYPRSHNGYHPRRGQGPLFTKYEKILGRFSLRSNIDGGDQQHMIVPADAEPPLRYIKSTGLQAERNFGLPLGTVRTIPINVHSREIPAWTQNDDAVRRFIVHRFPNAFKKKRVHKRAAELAAVIYYYFRCLLSCEAIAAELGSTETHVLGVAHDAAVHGEQFLAGTCRCMNRSSPPPRPGNRLE